ncbi:hypothetical protein [Fischerella sp. PCC 9605]|uniref:hypothetical protein n=1 Tax=Fischerella sp. PCC 9605 TaxID=1173024 RepID=UPI00047CEE1E|nr:hypothetical protein [Fischerella sp. PCC 9605]
MGWWKQLFITRAKDWIFEELEPTQVPPEEAFDKVSIPEDKAYFTITLRSMRIVNVRKLTTKFYGMVHSFSTLPHMSGEDAAFHFVIAPTELRRIDPQNLDRVVQVNKPLLGPIPYRGGCLGFELGLFSVKETDLAAPFIDVLETIASKAGVSFVSAAIPFIEPLKKGIDALTGASDGSILEIGVSAGMTPPKTGWYVVMRAQKGTVNVSDLLVTQPDYRLVSRTTGQLVQNYPYMVFCISASIQRSDWFRLPDLQKPYQKLREAVESQDYQEAQDLLTTFRRIALWSPDLITQDARRLANLISEKVREALQPTLTSRVPEALKPTLPALEDLNLYDMT